MEAYPEAQKHKYEVYTDAVHPVGKNEWVRVDSALLVLKAFRRLSNTYGFFRVDEKMVRMNQKNELKIWMNANPAAFHI